MSRDVVDRLRDALHDTEQDLRYAIQTERVAELRQQRRTLQDAILEIETLREWVDSELEATATQEF